MSENSTLISYNGKITRAELAQVPTPPATETHQPIAHHRVVEALVESMSFRHIGVVAEEYAVSKDGMRMFAYSISKPASKDAVSPSDCATAMTSRSG
jgi:hypothetical protein